MASANLQTAHSRIVSKLFDENSRDFGFYFFDGKELAQHISVHKKLLSLVSPKFQHLFDGEWKNLTKAEVDDSPYDAFNEFIQYFYNSEINITAANALDIMQLAKKYDVPEVVAKCTAFMATTLDAAYAVVLYSNAIGNESHAMKHELEQFISENIEAVMKSDAFLSGHVNIIKAILKLDNFQCPYVEVFDACIEWAKKQCERNQLDPADGNDIYRELDQLNDHIRFDEIDFNHLIERCHKYKGAIFSKEQLYKLFIEPELYKKRNNQDQSHEERPGQSMQTTVTADELMAGTSFVSNDAECEYGDAGAIGDNAMDSSDAEYDEHSKNKNPIEILANRSRMNGKSTKTSRPQNHLRKHPTKQLYECHLCKIRFMLLDSLRRHMNSHVDPKRKPSFDMSSIVSRHDINENGTIKEEKIREQNFSVWTSGGLLVHFDNHKKPSYECYLCKSKYKTSDNLRKHMKMHVNQKGSNVCDQCGKPFSNQTLLALHMAAHSDARPFVCNICSKGFKTRMAYNVHQKVHQTSKAYKCIECDFRTNYAHDLRGHMTRMHSKTPLFSCDICDKRFFSPRTLNTHKYSHEQNLPFKCMECDYQTIYKQNLMVHHESIHLKLKKHACPKCEYRTNDMHNLRRHISLRHGEVNESISR